LRSTKLFTAASAVLLLIGTTAAGAEPAKKRTTARPAAAKAKSGKKASARSRRPQRPARQAAPTPERYREIQQVLTEKGYYSGPVNGVWGAESVAALKRFQAENNLAPDGKLGALSLITLGLGPKRDGLADIAARPASEPPEGP
jgi:peptidoglycan hydrolase-like protein with peptidoglycan-binding domain